MRVRRPLAWCLLLAAFLAALLSASVAAPASAASGYYVTFVARQCDHYEDIFANKARNDIVESLRDLGPDSQYGSSGALVGPGFEDMAPQVPPHCTPLPNWTFTLGTGYRTRDVTGAWGSLSRVTGAYPTSIVTGASTPLLDDHGNRVGDQTIPGAVTIKLTDAQVAQASKSSSLWAQGGTPTDPVLASQFGTPQAPEFGLGTLRCATDNVNGDNVEYVFFPSGITHVFCYGYYVTPPPTSGTIVIHKEVLNAPADIPAPAFHFLGGSENDVSYDPNGFTLKDGQATSAFFRAGNQDWRVREEPTPDYALQRVDCTATADGGGPGDSMSTEEGQTETIHLKPSERVDCTFVNKFVPPVVPLTIVKVTEGAASSPLDRDPFEFTIDQDGNPAAPPVAAHTTAPGVPALAGPRENLDGLMSGATYTITEARPPLDPRGAWELTDAGCAGVERGPAAGPNPPARAGPVTVTIPEEAGRPEICTFTNKLTFPGAINLSKVTVGGTGTAAFVIQSTTANEVVQYHQHATTTQPGQPAQAVPNVVPNEDDPTDTTPNETDHVPFGTYLVRERQPPNPASGTWVLTHVRCDGVDVPFSEGAAEIRVTRADPHANCRFTDALTHAPPPVDPEPGEPGDPTPGGGGPGSPEGTKPVPGNVWANVGLSTRPMPSRVPDGHRIKDRVEVTNHGPAVAEGVTLNYQAPRGTRLVSVHTPRGSCSGALPLTCHLGILKRHQKVTLMVVMASARRSGVFTLHAALGTTVYDPFMGNNAVTERVHIVAPSTPAPPPFTG